MLQSLITNAWYKFAAAGPYNKSLNYITHKDPLNLKPHVPNVTSPQTFSMKAPTDLSRHGFDKAQDTVGHKTDITQSSNNVGSGTSADVRNDSAIKHSLSITERGHTPGSVKNTNLSRVLSVNNRHT